MSMIFSQREVGRERERDRKDMFYLTTHTKEPLLLIGQSNPCGSSGFPLSLSEWSFTICPTPYNRKYNVLSASLNKTFPSFPWSVWLFQVVPSGR